MTPKSYHILILVAFILCSFAGCVNNTAQKDENPSLTVSILPQQYFVQQIAGDLVNVNVLIPPGASPATYEPSVSQLAQLSNSEAYLRIGHIGFELSWMDRIAGTNPDMTIFDLSEGIDLIQAGHDHDHGHNHEAEQHHHSGTDPHIWLSLRNAAQIAKNTCDALTEILPEEEEKLHSGLEGFLLKLDSLDAEVKSLLGKHAGGSFMIYHPALAYFARDYDLQQFALEFEGKEPSPAHMKKMADLGREQNIHTIFLQKEFDQHNAKVLAREIDAQICIINPLDPAWDRQITSIARHLKASME